jgi:hypothetical protein
LRIIAPTHTYKIKLPHAVEQQIDGSVTSLWTPGEPLLLQVSSYLRHEGAQVGAKERLRDRMTRNKAAWLLWDESLSRDEQVDWAAAEYLGDDSLLWIHAYFVWLTLAVYATISGPELQLRDHENWARQGLANLTFASH